MISTAGNKVAYYSSGATPEKISITARNNQQYVLAFRNARLPRAWCCGIYGETGHNPENNVKLSGEDDSE